MWDADVRWRGVIRVLAIIPALNESATLPDVLASLRTDCPDLDLAVIDDGSTDDTAAVARAGGAAVLRLPYNLGIGGALRTGFRYAVEHDYDAAVQVDADGQHDPASIQLLLDRLDTADMVIGSRFAQGPAAYQVGRVRRAAMRMLELTVRLLTGTRYTDTSSGFRAFDRDVIEFFAATYPAEYMESVEALVQANYQGFRVVEVPIDMNERAGGAPSTMHAKLAYHYFRVIVTLLVRAQRRGKPRTSPAAAAASTTGDGADLDHEVPAR
jgi:glycosyltransferase involved in cell wall biosynthesis